MSAQIPESMLLSDLLKATGYDCPADLQGKTFAEATTGGDAKISTNTDKTIDVSAYTEPVEVEPAEGYDATKKVTVTLDNIPQAGASAYAWKLTIGESDAGYRYFNFAESPDDMTAANACKALRVYNSTTLEVEQNAFEDYTKTDDTHFSFEADGDEYAAVRDTTKDITLWG